MPTNRSGTALRRDRWPRPPSGRLVIELLRTMSLAGPEISYPPSRKAECDQQTAGRDERDLCS